MRSLWLDTVVCVSAIARMITQITGCNGQRHRPKWVWSRRYSLKPENTNERQNDIVRLRILQSNCYAINFVIVLPINVDQTTAYPYIRVLNCAIRNDNNIDVGTETWYWESPQVVTRCLVWLTFPEEMSSIHFWHKSIECWSYALVSTAFPFVMLAAIGRPTKLFDMAQSAICVFCFVQKYSNLN